ncbi:MAG TPA: Kae1-associated serine/threonine protein kinase [Nanoarchaeota archaeon]|nr:Kae1-associated serine/threonine protein kinase [Nanoarchaeota archaeon]
MKIKIAHGAEAILYKEGNRIIKDRVSKPYRIPEIDLKLRKERTRSEAKLIRALERVGVNVPAVLKEDDKQMSLEIEFLSGEKLRDYLEKTGDFKVCRQIGEQTAKMHEANIVHGDLTTSNMIIKGKKIYLIDFGLGEFSQRVEDKAVDLHLFKECLVSKHHNIWEKAWHEFTNGYKNKIVLERLKVVEARGRYKSHAL